MRSNNTLIDFIENNIIKIGDFGNCKFLGSVIYHSDTQPLTVEKTIIKIIRNGIEDGEISLNETDKMTSENFHLVFSNKYQDYFYDMKNNNLVISGKSSKMGSYNVTISC
ncbi:hypothetical protein [Aeromonas sp. sia0103]|uniref:hypothetical protein n=1 Tax=Aeromonas sp. sia0103 TaxID=2854782 RepID=UPI001C46813B|nr:hypothetical protein [Aeromonas sp. sia0103]MBV7598044.1 hypothetical protein [Aeromonas sp. sia0103]